MNTPRIDDIYLQLPRFIYEPVERVEGKYLPAVIREFERNGTRFQFIISPALIHDQNTGEKHYYPTKREEVIELALRQLAVNTNPNFEESNHTLLFSFDQLSMELADSFEGPLYSEDEVRLALKILAKVTYDLVSNGSEFSFRSIEQLDIFSREGDTYYSAQFSTIFLSQRREFNFCFDGKNQNKRI